MATVSFNQNTIEREWLLVDLEGETLGRVASRVAAVLRGKHKPTFTPNADCGDFVVVINADKVKLSGKKMQDKREDLKRRDTEREVSRQIKNFM